MLQDAKGHVQRIHYYKENDYYSDDISSVKNKHRKFQKGSSVFVFPIIKIYHLMETYEAANANFYGR
jgi:hypothetical protein